MTVFNNTLLLAGAATTGSGYQISRSLRFNSSDSAYCGRTFVTPTTQSIFTFSAWIKRSALGAVQQLFGASTNHTFGFTSGDALNLTFGGVSALTTTAVFRDPSAWYHVVWTQNGTAHTVYVNGRSVGTATATSSVFNTAIAHQIGAGNTTNFLSGYLTEIHFIDGAALTPTSLGEFDTNGIWQPKQYTGTYGTNGFKLNFADNSNNTATTLGKDTSGNGNNWTPNNLSVTTGTGNDSLVDSPTNYGTDTGVGGEVRGSFCTLNPVATSATYARGIPQNGNLEFTGSSGREAYGTIAMTTGKWYAEVVFASQILSGADLYPLCGICRADYLPSSLAGFPGYDASGIGFDHGGQLRNQGTRTIPYSSFTTTDIGMIAYDADTGKIWFGKNGAWFSSGSPSTGANPAATAAWYQSGAYFACNSFSTSRAIWNFGQRPFAYTAPSGFKALCTADLPTPTLLNGATAMDAVTYTGTGASLTPTSSLAFSPDLVWIKSRSAATDHALYDTVRGAKLDLASNLISAETTQAQGLTAFNSNGFTVGTLAKLNANAATYVAWTWDAGTSNVVNTQGSITSTVRANPSAGFSVVTYTGTGSGGTVGHGLGVAPSMIILKNRANASYNWLVYHAYNGTSPQLNALYLNAASSGPTGSTYPWNSATPTSTVFSIGGSADIGQMTSTDSIVAYCFAPVSGYSAFGRYTGNGGIDGPFVYTGTLSRWIMIKRTDTISDWTIIDTAREGYNVDNDPLYPNLFAVEGTTDLADILSNGFKLRTTDASVNASAGTYVYACFASNPFSVSRAR